LATLGSRTGGRPTLPSKTRVNFSFLNPRRGPAAKNIQKVNSQGVHS
jgi:hypothetical protein